MRTRPRLFARATISSLSNHRVEKVADLEESLNAAIAALTTERLESLTADT